MTKFLFKGWIGFLGCSVLAVLGSACNPILTSEKIGNGAEAWGNYHKIDIEEVFSGNADWSALDAAQEAVLNAMWELVELMPPHQRIDGDKTLKKAKTAWRFLEEARTRRGRIWREQKAGRETWEVWYQILADNREIALRDGQIALLDTFVQKIGKDRWREVGEIWMEEDARRTDAAFFLFIMEGQWEAAFSEVEELWIRIEGMREDATLYYFLEGLERRSTWEGRIQGVFLGIIIPVFVWGGKRIWGRRGRKEKTEGDSQ